MAGAVAQSVYTEDMIGTEELANVIASIPWHTRENVDGFIALDSMGDIPEGWAYVGSGGFRHVFYGPDGNVYKVPTAYARGRGVTNEQNYWKYLDIAATAPMYGIGVAACDYFSDSDVMVQEFVEGVMVDRDDEPERYYSITDLMFRLCKVLGQAIDIHSGNFLMVAEVPVLIDW